MSCGSIYKIQFPNGKHYIGQTTTSLEQRTKEHKCCAKSGDTRCLYNAIRKYEMVDTFELIEIDTADTMEELCEKECEYIVEYNSYYIYGNGYNMTHGGEGTNGYVFTEEDNKKNSERMKKYFEENPEKGKEHSEKMKKYYDDNPEAREQISEKSTKQWENPEARQQMSERKKKYFEENPEAREQMSEKMKKYHEENPEAREQMSEKMKKYFEENPEARQQMSEIKKKYFDDNPDARKKTSDGKGKNKPFDVFTKDGTFIKTFAYQFEAKEYLQKEHCITSMIKISSVLSGKRNSSAGFVFKYK